MKADYLYTFIIVIIIILVYLHLTLNNDNPWKHNKGEDVVIFRLNKQFIKMDTANAIAHMTLLKNNLVALNKLNYMENDSNILQIDKLIKRCDADFSDFKMDNDFNIVDLNISKHKLHNLFGSRYDNTVSRSDVYSDKKYEQYNLLNLIIDIQIVIMLLESGINDGQLELTNLHNLIKTYGRLTHGDAYISYDEIFGNLDRYAVPVEYDYKPTTGRDSLGGRGADDENTYKSAYTYDYGVPDLYRPVMKVVKHDVSQNIDIGIATLCSGQTVQCGTGSCVCAGEEFVHDGLTPLVERRVDKTNVSRNDNNTSHNTQYLFDSGLTAIIKRNTIPNYIPLCDINKIKTDKEKMMAPLIDKNARRSLRDDYVF